MNRHFFGRRPDSPDSRDRRFSAAQPEAARVTVPPSVDLRNKLPPCFDQGEYNSCVATSASAFLHTIYPSVPAFSRMQMYYDVRTIEKTGNDDVGAETRNVFKIMQLTGAAPESVWAYDRTRYPIAPPDAVYEQAENYSISSYSRLVAESSYLRCLAVGQPFVLGYTVLDSFDTDQLARTGVMPMPQSTDREISGHAVLVVGYDLDFKTSKAFKLSGLDPALVSDKMLLIRNSWGTEWGWERGHFWMAVDFATNPRTGGDAWVGTL